MKRLVQSTGALALSTIICLAMASPAGAAVPSESHTSLAVYTVTVKPGNSLSGLAGTHCGTQAKWPSLWAANPAIKNPNLIYVGQRIVINCAAKVRVSTTASRATVRAPVLTGWVHPLPGTRCVSGWGAPRAGHSHKGLDFSKAYGTPIRAAHAGTVKTKAWSGGAGYYIMLNHGVNQTVYMHLRAPSPLRVDQAVQAGQTIGYVGATGNATGPHLHFEVHRGAWNPIPPAQFMRAHGVAIAGC